MSSASTLRVRGQLEVLPVSDLLRFSLREDCSGSIKVRGEGQHSGHIAFSHGWILEATSPAVEGRPCDHSTTVEAVCDLMSWRSGKFEVELSSTNPIRQLSLEVELARLLREALEST
jgi:hypothetical protein